MPEPYNIEPDIEQIVRGLALLPAGGGAPNSGMASEMTTPAFNPVSNVDRRPAPQFPLDVQAGQGFLDKLIPGIQSVLTPLMSPGQQAPFRQKLATDVERSRLTRAAKQTQSLTNFLAESLASGDPEHLASAITQLSKLKNMEPETMQALTKLQIDLGKKVGEDREEEQVGKALGSLTPENSPYGAVIERLGKAGVKPNAIMSIVKSGLLGRPPTSKTYPDGTVVFVAGDGVFGRPGEEPVTIIPGAGSRGADKVLNTNDLIAFTTSGGKLRGPSIPSDMTPIQGLAALKEIRSMEAARLGTTRENAARLEPAVQTDLNNLIEAHALSGDIASAHRAVFAKPGTQLSATMKSALLKNQAATTWAQVTSLSGKTPAEQELAAQYNNVIGNLRKLTDERQLSEADAVRNLRSYNLATTPAQFQANVAARQAGFARQYRTRLGVLKAQGKSIAGYTTELQSRQSELIDLGGGSTYDPKTRTLYGPGEKP